MTLAACELKFGPDQSKSNCPLPPVGNGSSGTSITVQVEVYAARFRAQGQYVKVTEASLTYVAIDDSGNPRPVPKSNPVAASS